MSEPTISRLGKWKVKPRPQARILRTVGDKLVSAPKSAIIELVKNSFDADAQWCKIAIARTNGKVNEISIWDNGHGMSPDDIADKWMVPAIESKSLFKTSPSGRLMAGEKGIGRYSCAIIGKSLRLESWHSGLLSTIDSINWNNVEKTHFLDEVEFDVDTAVCDPSLHGVKLTIAGISDGWIPREVEELILELKRLITPNALSKGGAFPMSITIDMSTYEYEGKRGAACLDQQYNEGRPNYNFIVISPLPILDACDYSVSGFFDDDGAFDGEFVVSKAGLPPQRVAFKRELEPGEEKCGTVGVDFKIFDREAESIRDFVSRSNLTINVREARNMLDSASGISVYRNAFRIRPYGDSDQDWLMLDKQRVQNPSLIIGHNQIAGYVLIDGPDESDLREKSTREGLEENGSFKRLKALISHLLLQEIAPLRYVYRKAEAAAEPDVLKGRLRSEAKFDWIEDVINGLPEKDKAKARDLASKHATALDRLVAEFDERSSRLEALATLGRIVSEILHEGRQPISFISRESKWISETISAIDGDSDQLKKTKSLSLDVKLHADIVSELFNRLRPLSGVARRTPGKYRPILCIESGIGLLSHSAKEGGVSVKHEYRPEFSSQTAIGFESDLLTIFVNVLDNAIYWTSTCKGIKEISVVTTLSQQEVCVSVSDTGPGVSGKFSGSIFDVGFSLKPRGTGIGLCIAREAAQRSGGHVTLSKAISNDTERGATFEISVKRNMQ